MHAVLGMSRICRGRRPNGSRRRSGAGPSTSGSISTACRGSPSRSGRRATDAAIAISRPSVRSDRPPRSAGLVDGAAVDQKGAEQPRVFAGQGVPTGHVVERPGCISGPPRLDGRRSPRWPPQPRPGRRAGPGEPNRPGPRGTPRSSGAMTGMPPCCTSRSGRPRPSACDIEIRASADLDDGRAPHPCIEVAVQRQERAVAG